MDNDTLKLLEMALWFYVSFVAMIGIIVMLAQVWGDWRS